MSLAAVVAAGALLVLVCWSGAAAGVTGRTRQRAGTRCGTWRFRGHTTTCAAASLCNPPAVPCCQVHVLSERESVAEVADAFGVSLGALRGWAGGGEAGCRQLRARACRRDGAHAPHTHPPTPHFLPADLLAAQGKCQPGLTPADLLPGATVCIPPYSSACTHVYGALGLGSGVGGEGNSTHTHNPHSPPQGLAPAATTSHSPGTRWPRWPPPCACRLPSCKLPTPAWGSTPRRWSGVLSSSPDGARRGGGSVGACLCTPVGVRRAKA